MKRLKIGVLALQGGFERHIQALEKLGAQPVRVREEADLADLQGIVIPGGESTAIIKLLKNFGLIAPLRERILAGLPVFGTCAGMILLSSGAVSHSGQETLALMDCLVSRNDYGRQIGSFDTELNIPAIGETSVPAVFIRAPRITQTGPEVEILSEYGGSPVLVRQRNMLAASFHPELTDDLRVHEYFVSMIRRTDGTGRVIPLDMASDLC